MKRRLTAILVADVAGYSRLIGIDETGTIERLTTLRQDLLQPLIGEHGGRIVKLMGDGLLVEFASATGAVACALAWQAAVADREGRSDPASAIRYRIGINIAEVIVEQEDILGDGVNVAARLEAIGEPGTVCVSEKVYSELRSGLPIEATDLGLQTLKNIEQPVRAFRLVGAPARGTKAGASDVPTADAMPKERMVAVMPFANLSGDPADAHLGDELASEIITALSWMRDLVVAARQSSFALRDRNMTVAAIGRELGAGYVLEGAVRRAGQRLRVTAQLVDAAGGNVLWTERYDREAGDMFAVLDDIARQLVTALQAKVGVLESVRYHGTVRHPLAWELVVQATGEEIKFTRESNLRARELLERALALEPDNPGVKTVYAWAHLAAAHYGYVVAPERSLEIAGSIGNELLEDPEQKDQANAVLAWLSVALRDFDAAQSHAREAIRLRPNHPGNQHVMAMVQVLLGDGEGALRRFRIMARLNPYYPGWYLWPLCDAYRLIGDPRAYLDAARRYVSRMPGFYAALMRLVAALMQNGRVEEARARAGELLEIHPEFALSALPTIMPFRDRRHTESYASDLRRAGLPE